MTQGEARATTAEGAEGAERGVIEKNLCVLCVLCGETIFFSFGCGSAALGS
jgi:hypothetical protein